jgi:hypothetical protein
MKCFALVLLAFAVGFSAAPAVGQRSVRQPTGAKIARPAPARIAVGTNTVAAPLPPAPENVRTNYEALKFQEGDLLAQIAQLKATHKAWDEVAKLKWKAHQDGRAAALSARTVLQTQWARERALAAVQAALKELELRYSDLKPRPAESRRPAAPRSAGQPTRL